MKGSTPNLETRIKNKISLLNDLKNRGIWLLDASIAALYKSKEEKKKPSEKIMKGIIKLCWKHRLSNLMALAKKSSLEKIIVIGKGVREYLCEELEEYKELVEVVHQPQARIPQEEIINNYNNLKRNCS